MRSQQLRVFLFTDIVGSTRLWAGHPAEMNEDLAHHDRILRVAVTDHGGDPFFAGGDSVGAAFDSATAAADAAAAAQAALARHHWQVPGGIRVRMGIHVGEAEPRAGSYFGPALNEAARIMAAGHGGQVLLSARVAELVHDHVLSDLGEHRLRDLEGPWRLYQLDLGGGADNHPPPETLREQASTLPAQRTSLVGRERVISELRELARDNQIVTILGPGGAGKTRVAIEVAGRLAVDFSRAHFVDLTTVPRGGDVVPALVDGIGRAVPPDRDPIAHVISELNQVTSLIVLDNCEHVIDPAAHLVDSLASALPELHVIATSRVALDVHGEHLFPLGPLAAETPDSPAVRLFLDRALAVEPTQDFPESVVADVVSIVRRLDGIPLAIELAAARTRSLTTSQIREHLDDRFRLLVTPLRGDPRQRSLEAAIAWSVDLLAEEDRRMLLQLTICAGAFTLPLVARLIGTDELDALERLDRLVAHSLVRASRAGRLVAYDMLESVRLFGRRELRRSDELDHARRSLERALLPTDGDDMSVYINEYIDWSERTTVEAASRREAVVGALGAGRPETAARLLVIAISPTHPGTYEPMLALLERLRRELVEPPLEVRFAMDAADLQLQAYTFRLGESVETVERAAGEAATDRAAHLFFQAWRLMIMTAVDPEAVVRETEDLLPLAITCAAQEQDYAVSMMASARAIALLAADRVEQAHETARTAIQWARAGTGAEQIAVPALLWMEYTEGLPRGPELAAASRQDRVLPLESRVQIAAAIAVEDPIEERARALSALARRNPLGLTLYEECTFLVPFAWLAIEEGDYERAKRLLSAFASPDPGTGTAGVRALDRIQRHETGEPLDREAVLALFLAPDLHDRLSTVAPQMLAEELSRWDRRLTSGPLSHHMQPAAPGSSCDILGPLRLVVDGAPVEVTAPKHRAILVALALAAPRALSGNALIDAVWGPDAPATATRSLQSHISRLRSAVRSDALVGDTVSGYRLAIDAEAIDAHRFRSLVARAAGEASPAATKTLSSAVDLWRGEPASDAHEASALQAELASLADELLTAEEALAQALLAAGDVDAAARLGERLVAAQPLREARWVNLIDAHVAADRRGDALRAYQRARSVLVEQLGIDPGPALRAAEARALG